jgi:hypothetical protein
MNREAVQKVRDTIAAAPAEFVTMQVIGRPECDTPGCIVGWTYTVNKDSTAREFLGLEDAAFDALIAPYCYDSAGAYTQADVIATLDHLLETGEVKWPDACPRVAS